MPPRQAVLQPPPCAPRPPVRRRDDGGNLHSQWCLGSVAVTQTDSGVHTTFKAGSNDLWVERGGELTVEADATTQAYVDYKIHVYTSAGDCSGFDGGVRFKMEGEALQRGGALALMCQGAAPTAQRLTRKPAARHASSRAQTRTARSRRSTSWPRATWRRAPSRRAAWTCSRCVRCP